MWVEWIALARNFPQGATGTMKSSPTFVIATVSMVALTVAAIDYFRAFNSYNDYRDAANAPVMDLAPITGKEQRFLKEVKEAWTPLNPDQDYYGWIHSCEIAGIEPTVDGLARLLTTEITPFAYWDEEQNLREVSRAATLSQMEIETIDGKLHVGEGIAFIRARDNLIEYYEDTSEGIFFTFYGRGKRAHDE